MFCPKCGKQLNEGTAFCPNCGARIGALPNDARTGEMNHGGAAKESQNNAKKKSGKKLIAIIAILGLLILSVIVLQTNTHSKAQSSETAQRPVTIVKNDETRAAYLRQYGWEVETPAIDKSKLLIPETFTEVLESYNELQKEQGFDLSQYCGMEVELYTYKVLNYENGEDYVVAQLYVLDNNVIAGDVHSTGLGGFTVGIKSGNTTGKSKT